MSSPTPPTEFWGVLVSLMPVIIGGVIGVLGGLSGAGYGSRLSERRDSKTRRREKLEALVTSAYELDVWIKREENANLWNGPDNFEQSPLATIETVALLHFPELKAESEALSMAVKQYRMWILEGRKKKLASNPPIVPQDHVASLQGVYLPFLAAREALLNRAKDRMQDAS